MSNTNNKYPLTEDEALPYKDSHYGKPFKIRLELSSETTKDGPPKLKVEAVDENGLTVSEFNYTEKYFTGVDPIENPVGDPVGDPSIYNHKYWSPTNAPSVLVNRVKDTINTISLPDDYWKNFYLSHFKSTLDPEDFLKLLRHTFGRDADFSGGCMKIAILLHQVFASEKLQLLYNSDHIITVINGVAYDIGGKYESIPEGYLDIKEFGVENLVRKFENLVISSYLDVIRNKYK